MYKVYITKKEVYTCQFLNEAVEKVKERVNLENCNVAYSKGHNILECTDETYTIIITNKL